MKVSYHMNFGKGYSGALNKYGGLPTHLPLQWPQIDGCNLSFLFQIYCDQEKLAIPDTLCIQGYQLIEDGDYNSDIVIMQLPLNAQSNIRNEGVRDFTLEEGDILFQKVFEYDEYNENIDKGINIFSSKLQGWYPEDEFSEQGRFLGWLNDEEPFCIGANNKLCLFLNSENKITVDYY